MVWRLIIVLFVDVVNMCTKELVVEVNSSIVDVVVDARIDEVVVVERRRQRLIIVLL